jgi:hypothetical protein
MFAGRQKTPTRRGRPGDERKARSLRRPFIKQFEGPPRWPFGPRPAGPRGPG